MKWRDRNYAKITIFFDDLESTDKIEMLKWRLIDILTFLGGTKRYQPLLYLEASIVLREEFFLWQDFANEGISTHVSFQLTYVAVMSRASISVCRNIIWSS